MYQRHLDGKPNLKFNTLMDLRKLNGTILKRQVTASFVLGAGYVKHHIFNANLMKNGANYCVIINTGE
jgi:deoxyhypusine synthase